MSVEGGSLGRGVSIAASPTAFFETNMNIVSIIKAADVVMEPPVMVGTGSPILQQAEAVASAAWSKFEVPKAFHTALADVNLDPGLEPAVPKAGVVEQVNQIAESAWNRPPLSWWLIPTIAVRYSVPSIQPQAVPIEPIIPTRVESQQATYILPNPVWQPTNKTDQAVARAVPSTDPLPQQAPHQMVLGQAGQLTQETEIVAKPAADQDKIRLAEQQNLEEERLINVEDWQAAQQRRFEISQAIKRAWAVVKEGRIFGWMVFRFLPGQHEGNTSQLVRKKGPDGSLVDTEQAIKNDPREFKSGQEAKEGLLSYVGLFKPAKKALKGEPLPKQHVDRVLKFVKHFFAYEVFVQRITKKRVQVSGQNGVPNNTSEETEVKTEGTLEDYPDLAAVFSSKNQG